jgi:hypothetical protein
MLKWRGMNFLFHCAAIIVFVVAFCGIAPTIMAPNIEERIGDYKPGSIRRVRLHNFLTYSNVEFTPGPR